jgi:hypothetical protein
MRGGDALEEIQGEIGLVAVAIERVGIELVHHLPQVHRPSRRRARIEVDAGFGHPPSFALRLLALLGGERGEEGVEGLVALVEPVKLAVAPLDEVRASGGEVVSAGKQHMPGGEALGAGVVHGGLDQRVGHVASSPPGPPAAAGRAPA